MCNDPEREQPSARATLKIVLRPFVDLQTEVEVPESQARGLLDIPRRALTIVGPALTLLVAFWAGAPWWAAVMLAAVCLIVDGVVRGLEARRTTRLTPNQASRPIERPLGQQRPKELPPRARLDA